MAGDVVNKWLLDYICFSAWEEFKNDKTLSSTTIDLISGIIQRSWEGDERYEEKKLFLIVLSRIKDGQDVFTQYEEESEVELTPLEDVLPHLNNLVNLQLDDKLQQEGEIMARVIRMEAVLVCCRQGEFEKAQEVFDRLLKRSSYSKDKAVKRVQSYIKEKTTELDTNYSDFVPVIVEYLSSIAENYKEPLLLQAARSFLERQPCPHKDNQSASSTHRRPRREVLEKVKETTTANANNNSDVSKQSDKHTLRRLWDKNIKEMFGTPSKEKPSTSVEPLPRSQESVDKHTEDQIPSPSHQSTPKSKTGPVPDRTTPTKDKTGLNSTFKSPESPLVQYKKNMGREDRHQPVLSSTRCSDIDEDSTGEMTLTFGASRKRKWTEDEMLEFYDAVQTIGVGKWAQIKEYMGSHRTGVMLKDKWRTMIKSGDLQKIKEDRKKTKEN